MSWAPDPVGMAYALSILILLFSIPSILSLVMGTRQNGKSPKRGETLYEDEDGAATTQSTKEFSNKTQFTIIYVVSVIGFGLSIADFVLLATRELHIFDSSSSKNGDSNKGLGIELLVPAWVKLHLQHFIKLNADIS